DLFDTDYPLKLYRALLLLAEPMHISRRISFAASSGRRLEKHYATKFKSLDGKVVVAGPEFAKQTRYEKAAQKLSEFELSTPIVTRKNQVITALSAKLITSSGSKGRKKAA